MYLVDTNVFLEVLLNQEKRGVCKDFLSLNAGNLYITDFSLHSIGIILFRNNKEEIFQKFLSDIIAHIKIITLKEASYKDLVEIRRFFKLDFDDAYQYKVAMIYDLEIVTMDMDFEKIKGKTRVLFL